MILKGMFAAILLFGEFCVNLPFNMIYKLY